MIIREIVGNFRERERRRHMAQDLEALWEVTGRQMQSEQSGVMPGKACKREIIDSVICLSNGL